MSEISLHMLAYETAHLLVERLGAQEALRTTLRERVNARLSRNRKRFTFWAAVPTEIEALDSLPLRNDDSAYDYRGDEVDLRRAQRSTNASARAAGSPQAIGPLEQRQ
jgi:hypothetical protein